MKKKYIKPTIIIIKTCNDEALLNNASLFDINKRISEGLSLFRSNTFVIPHNVRRFIPAHDAILNAFVRRDPVLGEHAMALHIEAIAVDLESSKSY